MREIFLEIKEQQKEDKIIFYKEAGQGVGFVILHGWGSSSDRWEKIGDLLAEQGYHVIIPDLPGFGKTAAPESVWGVQEYAEFVRKFVEQIGLQRFVLAGHSFGGQIAVQFAHLFPEKTEKLVLMGAAAVRRKLSWKRKGIVVCAKIIGVCLYVIPSEKLRLKVKQRLSLAIGRKDYARAHGRMRDIFRKVTQEDLRDILAKVKTPTTLIWGAKDQATPLADGKLMAEIMPQAVLRVIPEGTHALNLQMPECLSRMMAESMK